MQQANENGIAHIVIRETLGAVAHFACGGWNYWVRLKHGGGQPCAACARRMAEMWKRERDAIRTDRVERRKPLILQGRAAFSGSNSGAVLVLCAGNKRASKARQRLTGSCHNERKIFVMTDAVTLGRWIHAPNASNH